MIITDSPNTFYSNHNTIRPIKYKLEVQEYTFIPEEDFPVGKNIIIAEMPIASCVESILGDGFKTASNLTFTLAAKKNFEEDAYEPIFNIPMGSGTATVDTIDANLLSLIEPTIFNNMAMTLAFIFANPVANPALPYSDEVKANESLLNKPLYYLIVKSDAVFSKNQPISFRTTLRIPSRP